MPPPTAYLRLVQALPTLAWGCQSTFAQHAPVPHLPQWVEGPLAQGLATLGWQIVHTRPLCLHHGQDAMEVALAPDATCALNSPKALRGVLATQLLVGLRVDWHLQAAEPDGTSPLPQLFMADMDATLIQAECLDELAAQQGLKAQVAAITERAMNGELPFEAALTQRVALLKGLNAQRAVDAVWGRLALMHGAPTLVATLKAQGVHTVVVSGGFTLFTSRLQQALGLDEAHANTLEVEEATGLLTGCFVPPVFGAESKLATLQSLCQQRGCQPQQVLAVGDGANDLPMLQAAGLGVAFHAKAAVVQQVPHTVAAQVRFGTLATLLYFVGLPKSTWVR